jgi:hypothetical protein
MPTVKFPYTARGIRLAKQARATLRGKRSRTKYCVICKKRVSLRHNHKY